MEESYKSAIKQKAGSMFKKVLWTLLILVLVAGTGYYFYRTYTKSEGTRTGTLFKVSKKGYVFKTYEGQLLLAGSALVTKNSTWDFSVDDAETYTELQALEGKTVKCYYKEKIDAFPWQGDTDYLVYKVEEHQVE
ncbi:MAG: hypothetical protein R2784_06750 [Saprospiraceae bacterium]